MKNSDGFKMNETAALIKQVITTEFQKNVSFTFTACLSRLIPLTSLFVSRNWFPLRLSSTAIFE